MSVAEQIHAIRRRMDRACAGAGRDPASVRLLCVTKTHPVEVIREAYACGQREFGENYVQELKRKQDALGDLTDLRFRYIGHLQRNKVRDLVALGVSVDTLDSLRTAEALARRAAGRPGPLEVLIELNVGEEPQKGGVLPSAMADLVRGVRGLAELDLRGVLVIPPAAADTNSLRGYFQRTRELAHAHGLHELSMGMSDDFELAIEEGATLVRLGTAIFGPRGLPG